jgi:exopolysaccharide biosynthesis predicted pyruvyltransferase EpsI
MRELISIIIPVYKVEEYLDRCVQSVINQTYKNLEIILVDDGSPDSCGAMCDQFANEDSRVVVIHKENGGLSDARNVGISIAHGEYIGFVDSDDYIDLDMFEFMYNGLLEYSADISVCNFYTVRPEKKISTDLVRFPEVLNSEEALSRLLTDRLIPNYAWNKLYRRKLFENVLFPVGRLYEDIGTIYLVFFRAEKVVLLNRPKYYYWRRMGSIVNGWSISSLIDRCWCAEQRYKFVMKEIPRMQDLALKAYFDAIKMLINQYFDDTHKNRQKENKKMKLDVFPFYDIHMQRYSEFFETGIWREFRRYSFRNSPLIFIPVVKQIEKFLNRFYPQITKLKKHLLKSQTQGQEKISEDSFQKSVCYEELAQWNKTPRVLIIGGANYHNLGDHAITFAQITFFQHYFPEYKIFEITDKTVINFGRYIADVMNDKDIIVIQGGGNFGNIYMWAENTRRAVIKYFKEFNIIILPQTIHFTPDDSGQKQLAKTIKLYAEHPNLTIAAREAVSYNMMKQYFPRNRIMLIPDMVCFLNKSQVDADEKRDSILICLRNDRESILNRDNIYDIKEVCVSISEKVFFTDTIAEKWLNASEREFFLNEKWEQFKKAKIVITDRLHGMIFSAITGTPCLVLTNYNHKIISTYEWLKHLSYIRLIDTFNISVIESEIKSLFNFETCIYNNRSLIPYFDELAETLRCQ